MHAVLEDFSAASTRAPVTLLFGDEAVRRGRVARLVAERGGRLAGHVGLDEAVGRLDGQIVVDLVVVDAGTDMPAVLLDRLADGLAARRFGVLLMLSPVAIDDAGRLLGLPGLELLVEPPADDVAAALDRLMAPVRTRVAEDGEEACRRRLAALGEDAGRLARALSAMATEQGMAMMADTPAASQELAFLRAHIRLRRLRERFFERTLFADPAWDILLDLRLATLEGRRVSVSRLCIAAAVPPTTGLRWIATMTEQGLLARVADPDDGRRVFVTLAPVAEEAMARYAATALRQPASSAAIKKAFQELP